MSRDTNVSLTLRGVVAAPDAFGRLRFLLLEKRNDKHYDTSWAALAKAMPAREGVRVPYVLRDPDTDRLRGEFTVTLPPNRRTKYDTVDHAAYWSKFVAPLRGKEVEVVAKPKRYSFAPAGKALIEGYSLTLVEVRNLI
jgi:hypothetical protein